MWRVGLAAFSASASVLLVELVATRVLAPFVGSSLHTWTMVLTVVLAGVSLGSALGGKLRVASGRTVAACLLGGALACVPALALSLGALAGLVGGLGLTAVLCVISFFMPAMWWSAVSTLAVRLAWQDASTGGNVAGRVSALGTLGSLCGNLAAGFVLAPVLSVPETIGLAMGLAILAAACISPFAAAYQAVTQVRPSSPTPGLSPLAAGSVMFICSAVVLLLEVGASRLLAPVYGVSLLSWAAIIGVVLSAMAAGNLLGARLSLNGNAPRLAFTLGVATVGCFCAPLVHALLIRTEILSSLSLTPRMVVHVGLVFVGPIVALCAVSPQAVRLAVQQSARSAMVGELWAVSTLGALAGALGTGLFLIPLFGISRLMAIGAFGLCLLTGLVGHVWRQPRWFTAWLTIITSATIFFWAGAYRSNCTYETNFFCIVVEDGNYQGRAVRTMRLDFLTHTLADINDVNFLGYRHNTLHAEFALAQSARPNLRILVIGGGGYVFPRWVEAKLPNAHIDVVEIDPLVTHVARTQFGLRPDSSIRSFALDGRHFVQAVADADTYDLVVQDAVNDLSVPAHLMTGPYLEAIRRILKPDGVFLLSVIDDVPRGQLLRSALFTAQKRFVHTQVFHDSEQPADGEHVYVIAMADQPWPAPSPLSNGPLRSTPWSVETQAHFLTGPAVELTDAFAPVDSMLLTVFQLRAAEHQ
jgi:predicted membrane-bound spermidine synthase